MRFPVGGVAVGRQSVEGKTDGRDRAPLVLGGRGCRRGGEEGLLSGCSLPGALGVEERGSLPGGEGSCFHRKGLEGSSCLYVVLL